MGGNGVASSGRLVDGHHSRRCDEGGEEGHQHQYSKYFVVQHLFYSLIINHVDALNYTSMYCISHFVADNIYDHKRNGLATKIQKGLIISA